MRISGSSLLFALALFPLAACDSDVRETQDLSQSSVAADNQNYAARLSKAHRYVYVARGSGNLSESDRAGLAIDNFSFSANLTAVPEASAFELVTLLCATVGSVAFAKTLIHSCRTRCA